MRSAALRFKELAEAMDLIEEEPTVVAIDHAWERIDEIERLIEESGINPLMIDVMDTVVEPELAGGLDADTIAIARERRLLYSAISETPSRVSLERRVSRRDLIFRATSRMIEWLNVPVLDVDLCNVLDGCKICVTACPYSALSGKPPVVDYDRCTSCGLCVGLCPIEALFFPALAPEGIEWFIKTIREKSSEPFHLVITTRSLLKDLAHLRGVEPTLVLPLRRAEELSPLYAARLFSRGFSPVIYARGLGEISKLYEELRSLNMLKIVDSVDRLREILSEKAAVADRGESNTYRGFFRLSAEGRVERVDLGFPGYADLQVNESACTLCGACERACPTGALRIQGDSRLLLLRDDCIGCNKCAEVCPERAIWSVKWVYSKPAEKELARSDVARCVRCGKPIGPERLIASVEKKLAAASLSTRHIRLCAECKPLSIFED